MRGKSFMYSLEPRTCSDGEQHVITYLVNHPLTPSRRRAGDSQAERMRDAPNARFGGGSGGGTIGASPRLLLASEEPPLSNERSS